MNGLLSIGDFSRMTFLSVKTLRHYHDVGLLEPAHVDVHSGYRYYRPDQVVVAQMIRRLRSLDLPVDEVRTAVYAADEDIRNGVIVAHLDRMSDQLLATQQTVDSLRRMLSEPAGLPVVRREEPAIRALAITESVATSGCSGGLAWWLDAFRELHAHLRAERVERAGVDGAIFATEFFTEDEGEVVAFVPVRADATPRVGGRVEVVDLAPAHVAVATYDGPLIDLDRAYGSVGTWLWERAAAASGPVRERYLPVGDPEDLLAHVTEVCWPATPVD